MVFSYYATFFHGEITEIVMDFSKFQTRLAIITLFKNNTRDIHDLPRNFKIVFFVVAFCIFVVLVVLFVLRVCCFGFLGGSSTLSKVETRIGVYDRA